MSKKSNSRQAQMPPSRLEELERESQGFSKNWRAERCAREAAQAEVARLRNALDQIRVSDYLRNAHAIATQALGLEW